MRTLTRLWTSQKYRGQEHLGYLRKLYPRSQRWATGAKLVIELRQLIKSKEGRAKGLAALRMGGLTRLMWVVKKPVGSLKRGQQVHNKSAMEHYVSLGATFREIRFPRDGKVKNALKRMARLLGDYHHPAQYGFVPRRDCVESAAQHAEAKAVLLLDLENAFEQVTFHQVVDILTEVFLVNRHEAEIIAELSCHDNHLYQGNPLAPAIFNLRAVWMAERLTRLCEGCGCKVTLYADDLTISTANWDYFSRGFRKTVNRIVHECGFKIKAEKSKVAKVSPQKMGHYDITGLTIDYDELGLPYVRPLHRKRVLKKAHYLQQIQANGAQFSNQLDKTGAPKQLVYVLDGLTNWAKREGARTIQPQLQLIT